VNKQDYFQNTCQLRISITAMKSQSQCANTQIDNLVWKY